MQIEILHQDRHFVAVNKPARLGVGTDDSGDDTLLQHVRAWNQSRQSPGSKGYCVPIHFLDRPVSGVILFALSSKGAARLNDQFRKRTISKTYSAIVQGTPNRHEDTLKQFLAKNRNRNVTFVCEAEHPDAKASELSYKLTAKFRGLSLLQVKPKTGRSHQIRVQLADLGTPIYGDVKYGASNGWSERIALHAFRLEFTHPTEKIKLSIEAPLPPEWTKQFPETATNHLHERS